MIQVYCDSPRWSFAAGRFLRTDLAFISFAVASGFQALVQRNVKVEVDSTTQVNAELGVGNVGEVVNVTGEAPLLKTEKGEVSDTLSTKAVAELPVLSRGHKPAIFPRAGCASNWHDSRNSCRAS
jgi:hypothetical protein